MEVRDIYGYLQANEGELGARILEMYPPLQSTTDVTPGALSTLLRARQSGLAMCGWYMWSGQFAQVVEQISSCSSLQRAVNILAPS